VTYGRRIALLMVSIFATASAATVRGEADFRAVHSDSMPGVVDLGSMVTNGDVRSFSMYMREGADIPGNTVRARALINCRDRTERIAAVAKQNVAGTGFDAAETVNEPLGKADTDPTGTLIVNLVCAKPADRDRYSPRLSAHDWRDALAASNDEGRYAP